MQGDGQACAGSCAATLYRALGHTKQLSGIGDRVSVHVDGYDRGALFGGQPEQRLLDDDRGVDIGRGVLEGVNVLLEFDRAVHLGTTQTVQTGVHDNAVQPAGDGGIVTEIGGPTVR